MNTDGVCVADEGVRQACAVTLQAITRRCPDVTKAHAAIALPLAFLGMHEQKPGKYFSQLGYTGICVSRWFKRLGMASTVSS